MDLLCHLVEHRDRVVPNEELLDAVWHGRTVSEAAPATGLCTARLAIGDNGTRQQFIRTVRRRGYQFVAHATVASTTAPITPSVPAVTRAVAHAGHEAIPFVRSADGTRIAYATTSTGPPRCGHTGSTASPATGSSSAMTRGAAASPTGPCPNRLRRAPPRAGQLTDPHLGLRPRTADPTSRHKRTVSRGIEMWGGSVAGADHHGRVDHERDEGLVPSGWYLLHVTDRHHTPSQGVWVHIR
ncbi:winged helix-turn-helix domain-containing protein [Streptomyces sp. NBC_01262]|uniref:winged helix-turn-helix domain-containing protein n=1 Tax=Streptomyces sp. NBC_01262 TaxID=2903803 RepID=UPI002E305045|nr:winged helix-turn-helix domain-containing protein [Streptomyces sp. NBC_01262]